MSDADHGEASENGPEDSAEVGQESAPELPMDLPSAEELFVELQQVVAERDEYLDTAQRAKADFDNFRKRTESEVHDRIRGGLGRLAEALLPVLDTCDAAVGQGDPSAEALRSQLMAVLEREGLERVGAVGEAFDPNVHEAVLHEAGDGGVSTVVEELRSGYRWNGKVLRAAMVKVRD